MSDPMNTPSGEEGEQTDAKSAIMTPEGSQREQDATDEEGAAADVPPEDDGN